MKTRILTLAFLAISQFAAAQLSMTSFLSSAAPGKTIETTSYLTMEDVPTTQCWAGAFVNNRVSGAHSPIAGEQLVFPRYGEKGYSIVMGSSFPDKVSGQRPTTYAFQRKVTTGVLYLSFVLCPDYVSNRKYWAHVGFSRYIRGNGNNCCLAIFPEGRDGRNYNLALRLGNTLMILENSFACKKSHLLVLKYDFSQRSLSLFVDPDLSRPETAPDEVATGYITDEENSIAGIIYRDVSGNRGNLGNFRVSRAWEDIR